MKLFNIHMLTVLITNTSHIGCMKSLRGNKKSGLKKKNKSSNEQCSDYKSESLCLSEGNYKNFQQDMYTWEENTSEFRQNTLDNEEESNQLNSLYTNIYEHLLKRYTSSCISYDFLENETNTLLLPQQGYNDIGRGFDTMNLESFKRLNNNGKQIIEKHNEMIKKKIREISHLRERCCKKLEAEFYKNFKKNNN